MVRGSGLAKEFGPLGDTGSKAAAQSDPMCASAARGPKEKVAPKFEWSNPAHASA
jgi:hypothetical protein